MELDERIKQLAKLGVRYSSVYLEEADKSFDGWIVGRFNGDGLEYVRPSITGYSQIALVNVTDILYRLLQAEIGDERAKIASGCRSPQSGATIESETHIILDFNSNMKYTFEMPSRKYLDSSSGRSL